MKPQSTVSTGFEESFSKLTISSSKENTINTLEEFTLFLNLPVELRLEIWKQALLNLPGRILILQEISPGSKHIPARFFCKHPAPTLAHVCCEASSFVRASNSLFKEGTSHTQICFDAEKDTILLGPQFRMKQLKRLKSAVAEGTKLKNLAVEFAFKRNNNRYPFSKFEYHPFGFERWEVEPFYEAFPALEKLIFVPQHDYSDQRSDVFRGEVKFQWPRQLELSQQEWEEYVAWARVAYEHELERLIRRRRQPAFGWTPEVQFMGLALVGGEMVRRWDFKQRKNFWVLAEKDEGEE